MKKIDWHAGFVSAMKLELMANEDSLEYEDEHHIGNRAQKIDLLIIKKIRTVKIVNEIGAIFDKYNILEYKGPGDALTYGDFYKTLGYTCIYLEELHKYDEYGRDGFTMTFVRRSKPRKLMKLLEERDKHRIFKRSKGIYEISSGLPFRTQIIVTNEWDEEGSEVHTWLRSLTNEGTDTELKGILNGTFVLDEKYKMHADSVMNVFARANIELVRAKKESEDKMCEAINELFAEETAAYKKQVEEANKRIEEANKRTEEANKRIEEVNKRTEEANKRAAVAEAELNDTKNKLQEALEELTRLKAANN